MDEKLLPARINDLVARCEKTGKPQFLGFLSEGESAIANGMLKGLRETVLFFGGYEQALRNFVCVAPDFIKSVSFPIEAVTVSFRKQDVLSHRDFLGSLMALGLTREKVGDILAEEGRAVIFLDGTISDFVISQINKVGKVGVEIRKGFELPLPRLGEKQEFSATVASNRLDCVVAALIGKSRSTATELIEASLVSVNSFLCEKPTQKIANGDKISIRKKGRFDIVSIDGISKKQRIILIYQKYV